MNYNVLKINLFTQQARGKLVFVDIGLVLILQEDEDKILVFSRISKDMKMTAAHNL